MPYSQPARTPTRRIPSSLVAGLLVVSAAIGASLGYQMRASSPSTASSPMDVAHSESPWLRLLPRRTVAEAASLIGAVRSEPPGSQLPPRQAQSEAAAPINAPPVEPSRRQLPPRRAEAESPSPTD